MRKLTLVSRALHGLGIPLALCLGFAGARPAAAAFIYDFSLAANGGVGAVNIQLTYADFVPSGGGLQVVGLSGAAVTSFSSGTPVAAGWSVIGFAIDSANTFFGLQFIAPDSNTVLYTPIYPQDFFVFARTADQTGTFYSTSGNVTSFMGLDTANPTMTLVVTDTSATPEPATASLLGLSLVGLVTWQTRKRSAERRHLSS